MGRAAVTVTEDYRPHIRHGGVWLLEKGDQLAGLIVLEEEPDHMLIFSVAVAPPFQGKGFGVRLLEWAEKQALDAGFGEIRLFTNSLMERNIALYRSFGYREVGRRPMKSARAGPSQISAKHPLDVLHNEDTRLKPDYKINERGEQSVIRVRA